MGFGALIKSFVDAALTKRQNRTQKQQEFKETRYKAIILLMLALLDFEKNKSKLAEHGRNFNSADELLDEIKDEYDNMILFASGGVIETTKKFIIHPDRDTFYRAALMMRKDLYGLKANLSVDDLFIQ